MYSFDHNGGIGQSCKANLVFGTGQAANSSPRIAPSLGQLAGVFCILRFRLPVDAFLLVGPDGDRDSYVPEN